MREIFRMRQKIDQIHYLPWRQVYFMPAELLEHVYTMLGPAMSYAWKSGTADTSWILNFYSWRTGASSIHNPYTRVRELKDYYVVVPLIPYGEGRAAGLSPHPCVTRQESRQNADYLIKSTPELLVRMRKNVDAVTATLHFDTGAEGMEPLCAHCIYVQEHLMGVCTPGLTRCGVGVVLPPPEKLVPIPKRKTQT